LENTMKVSVALAAAICFTAMPAVAAAQEGESADQPSDTQPSTQSRSTSTREGIKNDAAQAKQGVKNTAREIKEGVKSAAREVKRGVKSGAAQVSRGLAVAQCNDGRYSYTHHLTCNHHGGVKKRFR
jgi:hypothetical protein